MQLDQLPDDVLVTLMQHLDVDSLLACRLVCRRLCGLALHGDAWRHRWLWTDFEPRARAVLRLAPCLRGVSVCGHILPLIATRCSVAHLLLTVNVSDQGDGAEARLALAATQFALVVRNQEALGRLRGVTLSCLYPMFGAEALIMTLAATSGLESLRVVGIVPYHWSLIEQGPRRPTLEHFECELTTGTESFVNTVLAGHGDTLEVVDLGAHSRDGVEGYLGQTSETTLRLLGGMGRLRELTCQLLPGLEVVAACPTLENLRLNVYSFEPHAIEGACELLRRAHHLRSVCLDYYYDDSQDRPPEVGAKLIEALGCCSSGRSLVTQLAISALPLLQPLLGALPSLPALHDLWLSAPLLTLNGELAQGITPSTAPALRLLALRPYETLECVHDWLHTDTPKTVLTANPQLHILVRELHECGICEACELGCHRNVRWGVSKEVGLFVHDLGKCTSPEVHIVDHPWRSWIQVARCI
ncbi:uncharacterized protein LOC113201849 [Frankliniella occidentalis]|uniref:Uncharacterized protein LOC113201849 n=1 Tax=Frankliniella occidentalis TaxID=133901 RepID=A0A6J1RR67_FRAOC|nr:uncharacterized protein LOC113201849 [Frankliniella occidentalis]